VRELGWKNSLETKTLRDQISEYVKKFVTGEIPHIAFNGYRQFSKSGSRKESEQDYFEVRKQLTALGLYLQWNTPSEQEGVYFNELLWSVSNEFSWCLAAHLSYSEEGFADAPEKQIDLFAAETAATLGELLMLHPDKIDPLIGGHIRRRIEERVLTPFLERDWWWETSTSNWCSVCSGSIGMAALLLESGDRKKKILSKVEKALEYYIKGFGEDGATEEGIGYWVYGFGYYIYYTAMRLELDSIYQLSDEIINKIKVIAEFPQIMQMTQYSFLPFSDAATDTVLPTGLITYLNHQYGVKSSLCSEITPFDFDHCYRFAHISRNLWWTRKEIFHNVSTDNARYFADKQWLVQRNGACFFAVKGGNNQEEHNHNDVGSFILALKGELVLADIGAGAYTADYFSDKRYQDPHTRSYWHNLPLIQGMEQKPTENQCIVQEVFVSKDKVGITMELSMLYMLPELQSFQRKIESNMVENSITLIDSFRANEKITFEEGFVSAVQPKELKAGTLQWKGKNGQVTLSYNASIMEYDMEEVTLINHQNHKDKVYRLALRLKQKEDNIILNFKFLYDVDFFS
jgi:hypothetical protein